MPEFILPIGENVSDWNVLDAFTQGFIDAMFFTEEERLADEANKELPGVVIYRNADGDLESAFDTEQPIGFSDLSPCALARIIAACEAFQAKGHALIDGATEHGGSSVAYPYDEERAGNDFWYTLTGCGVSFLDRGLGGIGRQLYALAGTCRSMDVYLGDDRKVYVL